MARKPEQHDSGGYPAEKARGGRIVLNTPTRRAVFIGGLFGIIFLVLFIAMAA